MKKEDLEHFLQTHRVRKDIQTAILSCISEEERLQDSGDTPTEYSGFPFSQNSISDASLEQISVKKQEYEHIEKLGEGGMGEIWKVQDRVLNRTLAMKILHKDIASRKQDLLRFIDEAQICAQLEHPNIVPVHELGTLLDGRVYFTMKEIKGRTFQELIRAVHTVSSQSQWKTTSCGWSLFQMLDAFHQVCKGMAFAHSKGVIHRDLKPTNIMIGEYGEVLIVDWGIAKILSQRDTPQATEANIRTESVERDIHATMFGEVVGTPAYMAPEQANGNIFLLNERTDIYSLGVILYHLLSGLYPYTGKSSADVVQQIISGPPTKLKTLREQTDLKTPAQPLRHEKPILPIPDVLIDACDKAMARNPGDRFSSVAEFAQVISDWLDGSQQREKAQQLLQEAQEIRSQIEQLHQEADLLREKAQEGLKDIPKWETEALKSSWWVLEQRAEQKDDEAARLDTEYEQLLLIALTYDSALIEARESLILYYKQAHHRAESNFDYRGAEQHATRVRRHVQALPEQHPQYKKGFQYLKGTGALSLQAQEKDTVLVLERFEKHQKRLVPVHVGTIGHGSVHEYPIEMGSYRVRLIKKGFHEVHYPVHITRQEHWDGCDETGAQRVITMPKETSISSQECFVPAGWCWIGGGPDEANVLDRRRVWIDDFVMAKYPVTNVQFLYFLNSLLDERQESKALEYVPRTRDAAGVQGQMLYGRDNEGKFIIIGDDKDLPWQDQWPVSMITWYAAKAYGEWYARQTGLPWQLPSELQWEKSARGVDGRMYPWGNDFDPSYCCMHESHEKEIHPSLIDEYPIDCSVYGVRGMAGNVSQLTSSSWKRSWDAPEEHVQVTFRGGSIFSNRIRTMIPARSYMLPSNRFGSIGFRLGRVFSL